MGKKHRLKLSSRKRPAPQPAVRARKPRRGSIVLGSMARITSDKHRKAPYVSVRVAEVAVSVLGGIHILDLKEHHCRAIVGAGNDGLATYCGAQKEGLIHFKSGATGQSSYCVDHGDQFFRRDLLIRA